MKQLSLLFLVSVLMLRSSMGAPTDLGETWNVRFPRQTSENLNAIAVKGSTRVVAVGNRGTIISAQSFVPATAAQDWLLKTSVTTKDLLDVIWSDDQAQFVAVGAGGVALTSADGDTWAAATGITTTDRLNAAAATSAQNLVIVGATNTGAGVVYTSSNKGTAFTRRLVVGATSFSDVVWTGTKIVAACANKVFISTDGITWTSKPLASTTPTSLAFVSGKLVLIGSKSWQSSDAGTTWVSITVPTSDMTLNTVGTELIGANNRGEVWSSSDAGNSWQTRLIPQNIQFNAATRFGTDYVVVGEGGVIVNSTGIAAGEWIQKQVSPVTQDLTSVTANGPGNTATQAVAVGLGGKIIVASAFNSWAAATSITPFVASDLLKVIWSPSGYVAVGADGTIVTSNDGLAWTSKTISADKLTGVAWDGSKFVAVGVNTTGQGVVWSSTDAVHWTKNLTTFHLGNGTITAPPFTDLCWSSSAAQFRASAKDFALYSDDGLSWTARALTPGTQATSATPEGVISGNRAFRRSNDQWVSLPLPTVLPAATVIRHIEPDDKGADFVGLSPAGAIWFSVGYRGTAPPVWDDQNWQIQSNVQNLSLTDAVFFDSHVVLVGAKGTIETFTKPATDARTWRGLSSVGNSVAWNGKSGADALYVAVGWDMTWTGVLASGAASQSNIDWTPHRQGSTTRLFSAVQITYAVDPLKTNGLFVAVGGSIWTSPNGIDWTEKVSGPGADPSIYTVTRMGTTLFAFGYNNSQKQIYQATSTDYGVTWSGFIPVTGPIGTVNQPGFQWAMLAAAKAAGDFYLTVGWSGHYMVSSTGTATDWHEGILKLSYPKEDFTSVAWADGVNRYVITTNYGGFWSFDGNQFVKGTVWKSDGLGSWVKTSDGQGSHSVWAIKYVAGEFVAVGNAGFLWKSFNGIDWREYAPYETGGSGTPNYLYDLTFANTVPVNVGDPSDKVLVAVGGLGTIITTSGAKVPNQATITFTPNASSFSEKAGSVQFTAEISDRVFPGTLTLPLSVTPSSASKRFKLSASSLVFKPGELSKTFTLSGIDSAPVEADVVLSVGISGTAPGDLKQVTEPFDSANPTAIKKGIVVLKDSEPLNDVSFAVESSTVAEGQNVNVTVTLDHKDNTHDITVPLGFASDLASTAFIRPAGNVVKIPAGSTSAVIPITINNDGVAKTNKTILILLGQPSLYASLTSKSWGDGLSMTIHKIVITDDDTLPVISAQPGDQLVKVGGSATFSATVDPGKLNGILGGFKGQWLKNGKSISGHPAVSYTASSQVVSLNLSAVTLAEAGSYTLQVTCPQGTVLTTSGGRLGVVDPAHKTANVKTGGSLTLAVGAAGPGLSFQWKNLDGKVTGATSASLALADVLKESDTFTCTVGLGSTTPVDSGNFVVTSVSNVPLLVSAFMAVGDVGADYSFAPVSSLSATGWTISGLPPGLVYDGVTGIISGKPSQSGSFSVGFVARNAAGSGPRANLSFTVTPLPTGLIGRFVGTVKADPAVNLGLGAGIEMTVTSTGAFSGKLTDPPSVGVSDPTHSTSFTGNLGGRPGTVRTATVFLGTGATAKTVTISSLDSQSGKMMGTVKVGASSADITGWLQTAAPASRSGLYTWSLAPTDTTTGYSYGSCTVGADGSVTGSVRTADAKFKTFSSAVGPGKQVPVFALLSYSGSTYGSTLGELTLSEGSSAPINNTVTGALAWTKPSLTTTALTADGGRYFAPTAAQIVMNLPLPAQSKNLSVVFAGADLSTTPDANKSPGGLFSISPVAVVAPLAPNPATTSLQFTPATGEFSGKFVDKFGSADVPANFLGILVRPGGSDVMVGRGAFVVDAQTGSVILSRATP